MFIRTTSPSRYTHSSFDSQSRPNLLSSSSLLAHSPTIDSAARNDAPLRNNDIASWRSRGDGSRKDAVATIANQSRWRTASEVVEKQDEGSDSDVFGQTKTVSSVSAVQFGFWRLVLVSRLSTGATSILKVRFLQLEPFYQQTSGASGRPRNAVCRCLLQLEYLSRYLPFVLHDPSSSASHLCSKRSTHAPTARHHQS
jgi:hypothetical protein